MGTSGDTAALQTALGHAFSDPALLERALVHGSMRSEGLEHDNETLEFLGDAVIDLAVSELLMKTHPDMAEGELTKRRAAVVNASRLADLARALDLGRFLRLGKGERLSGGRDKERILASGVEALVGAVFEDAGYPAAREVVRKHLGPALAEPDMPHDGDSKTALQEFTQHVNKTTPDYEIVEVSGPDHDRDYTVAVALDGRRLAVGRGKSRKAAEQEAAAIGLARLRAENPEP